MIRHRYLMLCAAAIVGATGIALYLLGKNWLRFGAEAAALVVGTQMVLVVIAVALGGASVVGFCRRLDAWAAHRTSRDRQQGHPLGAQL